MPRPYSANDYMQETQGVSPINIVNEMQNSYLEYAMSVIISRAIPDVCDGLKPVHRRILYLMHDTGSHYNKPYKKSARIVGNVMGRFHPHGDTAIYDSLARMAQDFALNVPLIDGQGNFGSIDGDAPAAMRYTECRLDEVSHTMLDDIDKKCVDFQDNYDNSEQEPVVLPAKFPNLLVNGSGGIAVGMATNIPPFNLGEVIDACLLYIKNPDITSDDILEVMQGPDFPTAGIILGKSGIRSAIATGRGSILVRGKVEIEENGPRQALVITEVPYLVNKASMVEKIADLVRAKEIEGISDIRDESSKAGIRVVIDLKRDAMAEVVLNNIYALTQLQTTFSVNMLALDNGHPRTLNVLGVISRFIKFRQEVVYKRTVFLLEKIRIRAHTLIGLFIATHNIDEVIKLIRASADTESAKAELLAREWKAGDVSEYITLVADKHNIVRNNGTCKFTPAQAQAILEMRLNRLTGLERGRIVDELKDLGVQIQQYIALLSSPEKVLDVIAGELSEVKAKFGKPRRTAIELGEFDHNEEDLIPREDMVVTITHKGYIKRCLLASYRAQKRGGVGRSALQMHEEDFTTEMFVASTHSSVLFFSNVGKVYKLKVYKLPLGQLQSKGRALVNLLPLAQGESITSFVTINEDNSQSAIIFATALGNVRRNDIQDFLSIPSNGKIAMRVEDGDRLVGVKLCTHEDHIFIASRKGQSVRFPVSDLRIFKSRTSDGVRGIKLANGDEVIGVSILHGVEMPQEVRDEYLKIPRDKRVAIAQMESLQGVKLVALSLTPEEVQSYAQREQFILVVTENGYGKRTSAYEYRVIGRGGAGVINIQTSNRNGCVVSSFPVRDSEDVMLITSSGVMVRCSASEISVIGRSTQGVTLVKVSKGQKIVSVAPASESVSEDDSEETSSSQ